MKGLSHVAMGQFYEGIKAQTKVMLNDPLLGQKASSEYLKVKYLRGGPLYIHTHMHTHYDWSQIKRRMLIQDQSYFTGYIKSLLSKSELCLQDKLADEQTSETNDWGDLWQLQLSAYKTAANMLRIPRDTWRLPIESIQDMFSKNLEHKFRHRCAVYYRIYTECIITYCFNKKGNGQLYFRFSKTSQCLFFFMNFSYFQMFRVSLNIGGFH